MFSRRRRKKEFSEKGGINFWLSASDLLSSLIFLFLLLLLFFSLQFKDKELSLAFQVQTLKAPAQMRKDLLHDLQTMLKKEGVDVVVLPEEGILRFTEQTLNFEEAKAFPHKEKLSNLALLARALNKVLPCMANSPLGKKEELVSGPPPDWCPYPSGNTAPYHCPGSSNGQLDTLLIEGHTDAFPLRVRAEYVDNFSLSAARATTVLRLLMLCEGRLGQLFNSRGEPLLAASGYSSLRPLPGVNPFDARNRRIDIRFLMEPSKL